MGKDGRVEEKQGISIAVIIHSFDRTLQNDCVRREGCRLVRLENFILFIPNGGFGERWNEGGNLCYDWIICGFDGVVVEG